MMDVNIENRGKESNNASILNLDCNPDIVIHPFTFELQHSSSLGEEEISVEKKLSPSYPNVTLFLCYIGEH